MARGLLRGVAVRPRPRDPLARLEARAGDHGAGEVDAEREWRLRLDLVLTAGQQQIRERDADRVHVDQDVVRPGRRVGRLAHLEVLGTGEVDDLYGEHGRRGYRHRRNPSAGAEPSAGPPFGRRLFLVFEIEVDVADLAKVRFTTDAVWETTASIHAFVFLRHHLLHQRLRRLVPKRPDFDLDHLLLLARDPDWLPDVWAPPPSARPGHPLEQLDALRHTDLGRGRGRSRAARASWPRTRPRPGWSREEYLDHTAAALQGWWAAVLEPLWDRVDAIQRADIAHHQSALATGGLAATMPELHRGLSFGGGRLRVDLGEGQVPLKSCGQGIWFVPSVFRWPWVALDTRETVPHVVSYGARGAGRVWQQPGRGTPTGLPDLIGRSRALILESLDVPRSTTTLSQVHSASRSAPGDASTCRCWTTSGLLESRRDGQRVLYWRTTGRLWT